MYMCMHENHIHRMYGKVCKHTLKNICIQTDTKHIRTHTHKERTHTYIPTYIYLYSDSDFVTEVYKYIQLHKTHRPTHTHAHTHARTYTYRHSMYGIYMHAYMYVYTYACTHKFCRIDLKANNYKTHKQLPIMQTQPSYVQAHIHTSIHAGMGTSIHTYVHTCRPAFRSYTHAYIDAGSHLQTPYIYTCIHTVHICRHALASSYMHACMHTYVHADMHLRVPICRSVTRLEILDAACICVYMHACMHVCMHVCKPCEFLIIHFSMYECMCLCMYVAF